MKELAFSLDLEMNQPSGKIIQIGVVVGNVVTGEVVDRFSRFVNPEEPLSDFIIGLTGITQQDVDQAPLLSAVYSELASWAGQYKKKRHLNPITWGGGDSDYLRRELKVELDSPDWILGRRWLDAKTVFSAWSMSRGKTPRAGLSAAMKILGMNFAGRAHDAGVDAENTFAIWCELMRRFKSLEQS
jgi:inhibitor of KinA sporulation pathway (predicted exonuclease)